MFHVLWKALGREEKLDRVHTCSELKFGTPFISLSLANCRGSPPGPLPWETWLEEAYSWFPGLPLVVIIL